MLVLEDVGVLSLVVVDLERARDPGQLTGAGVRNDRNHQRGLAPLHQAVVLILAWGSSSSHSSASPSAPVTTSPDGSADSVGSASSSQSRTTAWLTSRLVLSGEDGGRGCYINRYRYGSHENQF